MLWKICNNYIMILPDKTFFSFVHFLPLVEKYLSTEAENLGILSFSVAGWWSYQVYKINSWRMIDQQDVKKVLISTHTEDQDNLVI